MSWVRVPADFSLKKKSSSGVVELCCVSLCIFGGYLEVSLACIYYTVHDCTHSTSNTIFSVFIKFRALPVPLHHLLYSRIQKAVESTCIYMAIASLRGGMGSVCNTCV